LMLRAQQRAGSLASHRDDGGWRTGGRGANAVERRTDPDTRGIRTGTGRRRTGRLVGVAIAALAVVALITALDKGQIPVPVPVIFGPAGVAATVVPGDGYRMRAGPSASSPQVGAALSAGSPVTVACLERRWAKLLEPVRDVYVHVEGLQMSEPAPPC